MPEWKYYSIVLQWNIKKLNGTVPVSSDYKKMDKQFFDMEIARIEKEKKEFLKLVKISIESFFP